MSRKLAKNGINSSAKIYKRIVFDVTRTEVVVYTIAEISELNGGDIMVLFRKIAIACTCVVVMGMWGCGSDDNNSSINSRTGYFIDDFVMNLDFDCGGITGKTDEDGAFEYIDGEGCTFRLGGLEFYASPETLDDKYLSPYELTENEQEAVTLAAIIQSASIPDGKRLLLLDEITKTIQNPALSNGNESVKEAFGSNPFSIVLTTTDEAKVAMSKSLDSNGKLLLGLDEELQNLKPYNGIASLGFDILEDAAKSFLSSEVLKAFGLDNNQTSQDLKEITDQLDKIESQLATIEKQVEALIGDFAELDTYIEKTQYSYYSQMLSDMSQDTDVIWNSYKGAFGKDFDAYLDERTYDKDVCTAFKTNVAGDQLYAPPQGPEPLFEAIAVILQNFSSSLTDNTSYLPVLFGATQNYLLANRLPQRGKPQSTGLKSIIDQYNEGLMNQFAFVLLSLQKYFIIEQTLVYMGSSDTRKYLCNLALDGLWIQHDTESITPSNTYAVNFKNLQASYTAVLKVIKNAFNSAIISDKIDGSDTPKTDTDITSPWIATLDINTKIANPLGDHNYIPDGKWKDSCVLYQWYGFSSWGKDTFQGDFDGGTLNAYCTYKGASETCSLPMATRCHDGSTDEPVMTETEAPYLDCEYLAITTLVSAAVWHADKYGYYSVIGGTSGTDTLNNDWGDGKSLVAAESGPTVSTDFSTLYWNNGVYSQIIQIIFSNNERALFNILTRTWENTWSQTQFAVQVQCGNEVGDINWSCYGNTGSQGGHSVLSITSERGETASIWVEGNGGHSATWLHVANEYPGF